MIETERLILRRFKEEDYNDLFEYLHEPQVNCFVSMKLNTIKDAKRAVFERMNENTGLYFAIILKSENKVIGELFVHPEENDKESYAKGTLCPCWMLNKSYQRHGYMNEASTAYVSYIFGMEEINRLFCYTEDYNIPTQKGLEKLGFKQEKLFKNFISFISDSKGVPILENTFRYVLLKKDWISRR